jgi:glutamate-1-semialdehyde aminotransferase
VTTYRSTLKADRKMLAKYNDVMLKNGILKGGQKYYVSTAHTDEDVERTIQAFKAAAEALRG